MDRLRCWWLHRHLWMVLIPGVLPWHLDAEKFCPKCDHAGGGIRPRLPFVILPVGGTP